MEKTSKIIPTPIEDVKTLIDIVNSMNLEIESIDNIKTYINKIIQGYVMAVPQFEAGLTLYRARKFGEHDRPATVNELGPPPVQFVTHDQRCSRAGQTMFYCSSARNAPFFEINSQSGEYIVMSKWLTCEPLLFNHVGYTKSNFGLLGSTRESPTWGTPKKLYADSSSRGQLIDDFLARKFSMKVSDQQIYFYKSTIAISELLVLKPIASETYAFAGIMYPTIPMNANCENFAIFPKYFRTGVRFVSAEFIKVKEIKDLTIDTEVLDFATADEDTGSLIWKGHPPQYILKNQNDELTFTTINGEWVATNQHGEIVLPE